jgi:cobaltochelatase CobT
MLDKLGKYSEELAHCTTILDKYEGSKATYTLAKKILEEFKIEEELNEEEQKELNKLLEQLSEALESIHEAEYIKKNTSREEGKPSGLAKSDLSFGSWSINPNVQIKNIFKEGCPEIDESLLGKLLDSAKAEQGFSNQVRRLIQIRSRNKFEYGVKKGKLDSSRISRICMKDAPGFNERIFKQKYVSEVLNAAVSLLVDTSGSMNGTRYFNASKSVLLLNEAIGKALHVPLEIVGYTDYVQEGDPILMCIHKEFDTPRSEIDLAESLRVSQAYMRGNADGESILWSYDRLKQRKEKKKILIVFSDGAPAASRSQEGIYRFTKQVISEIEKENIVDIYGIGIEDESVKELYTHQCTIQDSSEISNKLLQVIEHKLLTNRI